ncbi:MAG TPA: PKD domain-containing protein [Candidatus Omnitrophota bacterium]|nr:PKD domain-containing protein [Candidatus Omnitrophota bacterium]HPT38825.1 PKD domain-containing protein [Candidatus Omnitrophota bacterium]
MKKIPVLLILAFLLSGCATYKFQKPNSDSQGYLAYYDGYPLAEYTVGKDKSLPDLTLAKERFKRRKSKVEYYYKKMDQIESRLKAYLWEPPAMVAGFIGGLLRWPFIAVADYKYNHNSKYKAKVDKDEEEKETLSMERVANLRKELDAYIAKDLAEESGGQGVVEAALSQAQVVGQVAPQIQDATVVKTEAPALVLEPAVQVTPQPPVIQEAPAAVLAVEPVTSPQSPAEIKSAAIEEVPAAKKMSAPPTAVIVARPLKGYSPLKVNFSGQKSYSQSGKIVSYLWDFGDGDTSTKKNPENTYWSTTFGSRNFTVTLTVRDQEGSVSSATSVIEVVTR